MISDPEKNCRTSMSTPHFFAHYGAEKRFLNIRMTTMMFNRLDDAVVVIIIYSTGGVL